MNTHEYQAKELLVKYGVPVPEFTIVSTIDQLKDGVEKMGLMEAVLKVQVHAGGRGKAGGVKLAKSKEEIMQFGEELIGKKITNNQTGPEGVISHEVMLTPLTGIKKEYYIGAIIDRKRAIATLIASPEGGMEIEEVAAKTPEKILTLPIKQDGTMYRFHLLRLAKFMGWEGKSAKEGMAIAKALAKMFIDTDASLLEINPLIMTDADEIVALDAKLSVDDNALFRQPAIKELYDERQVPRFEAEAEKHDLAYIALDGDIGCMVNGAGLAMATMDLIQLSGGEPANFLDVGGGATKEKVAEGFKILLSDQKVKAILVNIFGGIMSCATIAEGIIAAANQLEINVPLIVRLEGTNVEKGKELIKESGLNMSISDNLSEAAELAVKAAKGGE